MNWDFKKNCWQVWQQGLCIIIVKQKEAINI